MNIEEIVKGLKEQGLDDAAVEASLKEMLEKGEISEEDFRKAVEMLHLNEEQHDDEEDEKELAKKLYGDDLFD